MKKYQNIIFILIAVVAVVGLIWLSNSANKVESGSGISNNGGALSAEETAFNFGSISMARGNVSHVFKIKNTGTGAVTLSKIYTSCMCTQASLKIGDKIIGPFGMPGMGAPTPYINQNLNSGEEAEITVVFDPTAHGPAGVGFIERVVYVENSSGKLQLSFKANVAP